MAYQSTQAIVLRRVDYREHDRILTLLTPSRGRVDAVARGCRRPKSPLMPACELFTLGEYVLYKGKGHEGVTSCAVSDSFYPLRDDFDRLSYAAVMLAAATAAAQPEEPHEHLMILLTRSLARLAYGQMDPAAVTAAFLLHFAALIGYKPRLNHCVLCGEVLAPGADAWLNPLAGGLVCRACYRTDTGAMRLDGPTVDWLRSVLKVGIDKTEPALRQAPVSALKRYVEQLIEQRLPKLPEYVARL